MWPHMRTRLGIYAYCSLRCSDGKRGRPHGMSWGLCIHNADLATVMQKKVTNKNKKPSLQKLYVLMQNLTLKSLPNIKCLFRFTGSLRSVYCILHTKQRISVEVHFTWQNLYIWSALQPHTQITLELQYEYTSYIYT